MLISLVGTDVRVTGSLMREEARVPKKNPRVKADDRHTLSHTTYVDLAGRNRVAAMRSDCIVHYTTWTPFNFLLFKLSSIKTFGTFLFKFRAINIDKCQSINDWINFKKKKKIAANMVVPRAERKFFSPQYPWFNFHFSRIFLYIRVTINPHFVN